MAAAVEQWMRDAAKRIQAGFEDRCQSCSDQGCGLCKLEIERVEKIIAAEFAKYRDSVFGSERDRIMSRSEVADHLIDKIRGA